jgi:hypothetical protein
MISLEKQKSAKKLYQPKSTLSTILPLGMHRFTQVKNNKKDVFPWENV